jgi:hypothetical protein
MLIDYIIATFFFALVAFYERGMFKHTLKGLMNPTLDSSRSVDGSMYLVHETKGFDLDMGKPGGWMSKGWEYGSPPMDWMNTCGIFPDMCSIQERLYDGSLWSKEGIEIWESELEKVMWEYQMEKERKEGGFSTRCCLWFSCF